MFPLRVICTIFVLTIALVLAQDAHDHDHDHTHAPTLPGKCQEFPPIASLDVSKLNGEWFGTYCLKRGFDNDHDHTIKCVKKTIAAKPDGSFESDVSMNRDGHEIKEKCVARPLAGKTGQFSVEKEHKEDDGKKATMTVLDTDNTGYLIVAGCVDNGEKHGDGFQVFSRSKTLPDAHLEKANALLKKLNIDEPLEPVEQNC